MVVSPPAPAVRLWRTQNRLDLHQDPSALRTVESEIPKSAPVALIRSRQESPCTASIFSTTSFDPPKADTPTWSRVKTSRDTSNSSRQLQQKKDCSSALRSPSTGRPSLQLRIRPAHPPPPRRQGPASSSPSAGPHTAPATWTGTTSAPHDVDQHIGAHGWTHTLLTTAQIKTYRSS